MRLVIQRVRRAAVTVGDAIVGEIGAGLVVLVGVTHGDGPDEAQWLASKTAGLRVFEDDHGKMNRSVQEIGGSVLVVSQFTLYADARKGRRPAFVDAAPPDVAEPLIEQYIAALRSAGLTVATGQFRAEMQVALVNDGPVTIILERNAG